MPATLSPSSDRVILARRLLSVASDLLDRTPDREVDASLNNLVHEIKKYQQSNIPPRVIVDPWDDDEL